MIPTQGFFDQESLTNVSQTGSTFPTTIRLYYSPTYSSDTICPTVIDCGLAFDAEEMFKKMKKDFAAWLSLCALRDRAPIARQPARGLTKKHLNARHGFSDGPRLPGYRSNRPR